MLVRRYKRGDASGERGGLLPSCLSLLTFLFRCVDDSDADAHEREAEEDAGRDGIAEEEVADDDADDWGDESEDGEAAG